MSETDVCVCRLCRRMQRKAILKSPRDYGLKVGVGVPEEGGDTAAIIGENAWAVAHRALAPVNRGYVRLRMQAWICVFA